ncbi:hypothetical protein GCM10022246_01280 [Pedobacter ginsengiterrae]|uniref:DUF4397 domain-containing protein n=2 Tax=Pedobacter ginsengiterrae TaxID=871696 RepID=A0ABP7NN15_9SPHI
MVIIYKIKLTQMNIRIYSIIALMILISAFGCKKQDIPLKPEQSATFSAKLEDTSAIFPAAKTITFINIIAGTNGWSLTQSTNNALLVADKNFGAGDYKLRVTLNANTTGVQRSTTVKLVSTNSSLPPVLINVTQDK